MGSQTKLIIKRARKGVIRRNNRERFRVVTGVKQGCCKLGFLFLMVTDGDWVMRKTGWTEESDGTLQDYWKILTMQMTCLY